MNKRDMLYFRLKEKISNEVLSNLYKMTKNIIKNNNVAKHFNINVIYLTNQWWNKTHLYIYSYNELLNIIEIAMLPIFKPIAISDNIPVFNFSNGATIPLFIQI